MKRDPRGFYVYVLFRETGVPFYVGKGRDARWLFHEKVAKAGGTHKDRLIQRILSKRADVPKVKVREGLTNAEARITEVSLIAAIGREKDGGPLINQTRGGDGCVEPDEEVRYRMGNGMRGRKLSDETRAKMKAAKKGYAMSPEDRARAAKTRTGQKRSDEAKAKMRAAKLGKKQKPEHVAARTAKIRGRKAPPEECARKSAARLAIDASAIVKNSWRPGGPRRTKLEGKLL